MSDSLSRERLVKELNKNILVRASAGSGKTTILVERVVALIESGVPINEIVAVTFTKKAANEFYERLYHKLEKRIKPDFDKEKDDKYSLLENPNEKAKEYDLIALRNIDSCFLGTMDSFVQTILNEHPIEANIRSSAKIISDEEFALFLTDINSRIHFTELKDGPLKLAMTSFDSFSDRASLTKFVSIFFNNKDIEFEEPLVTFDEVYESIKEKVSDLKEGIKSFYKAYQEGKISKRAKPTQAEKDSWETLLYRYNQIINVKEDDFVSIMDIFSNKSLQHIGFIFNEEVPLFKLAGHIEVLNLKKEEAYNLSLNFKELDELKYLSSFYYPNMVADLAYPELINQGKMTFKMALELAVDLFRRDNQKEIDVLNGYKKRYKYFLIDESQDTDILQYELFFRLVADENKANWKNSKTRNPGSLFIVGDKKQSIYHFKGADISTYEEIEDIFSTSGEDYEIIELTNNFRSDGKLTDYFNDAFNNFMTPQGYKDIPKKESKIDYAGAYLYKTENDTNGEDILRIINNLVSSGLYSYKDFMVLTSSKAKIPDVARVFSTHNIPYFSEGDISYDTKLIKGVVALLNYAVNPSSFNKYVLLTSDLFKVDVTRYLDEEVNFLDAEFAQIKPNKVSSYIEDVISSTNISKYLSLEGFDILVSLIHVFKTLEIDGAISSISEGVDALNKTINEGLLERTSLIKNEVDAVHIANVHKVKGLQNKIVILAFAGGGREKSPDKYVDLKNQKGKIFAFVTDAEFAKTFKNPEYLDNDPDLEKEKAYQADEADRLLYVAATRAEHMLFIPDTSKSQKWDKLKANLSLKEFEGFKPGTKKIKEEEKTFFDKDFDINKHIVSSSKSNYHINNGSKTKVYFPYDEEEEPLDDFFTVFVNEEESFDPLLFGTMVHKLMENLVLAKGHLGKEVVDYTLNQYNAPKYKTALLNVYNTIINGGYPNQEENVEQDIAKLIKENECYAEVPFSYKKDNDIFFGIIDLLVVKDDEVLIIDYKTDEKEIDHSSQLEAYKNAIKVFSFSKKKKINAKIYYIREEKRLDKDED